MKRLHETTFICLDSEFTGLDQKNDRVIEVAAARFTLDGIIDTYQSLVNPEHPISHESEKIHHISQKMISDKPKMGEILPDFLEFVGKDIIVGHAINFDLQMLEKEAKLCRIPFPQKNNECIDTLRLARSYGDSPNNSLTCLAQHFNVKSDGAHRAMTDVNINIDVFKHLIRRFKTLGQIRKILANPIQMKYMPLGKYKGYLFADLPLPYLQWSANMDFDQDLLFSIRLELKKRKQGKRFSQANNPFSNL